MCVGEPGVSGDWMKSEKWDADLNAFASHSLVSFGESVHSAKMREAARCCVTSHSAYLNFMKALPRDSRRVTNKSNFPCGNSDSNVRK
jgi:hypothetical protein